MAITSLSAWWFLPFVLPICIWVAWSDMKFMKIPNKAVAALMVVFVTVGLAALPLAEYPWRALHFVVVLAIGFAMNMAGALGAGDAKFAAAAAPFVALGDLQLMLYLFSAVLLAAVATHTGYSGASRRCVPPPPTGPPGRTENFPWGWRWGPHWPST